MTTKAHVIIYTKPGCHLCEEARREIAKAACGDLFTLEEVNIETDPALVRRYGWEIPVVTINGIMAFKNHVRADEFRDALRKTK
ncbi:MAG: glutaredoxin family protein [Acidobacteria bacterium]|nr:glutaredoxin family protein [Acidobacteriota bacterium]